MEKSIKKSLENYELTYNPSAWTALSAKLDVKSPAAAPKSNMKWYLAASAVAITAVASYFVITSDSNEELIAPITAEISDNLTETNNSTRPTTTESNQTSQLNQGMNNEIALEPGIAPNESESNSATANTTETSQENTTEASVHHTPTPSVTPELRSDNVSNGTENIGTSANGNNNPGVTPQSFAMPTIGDVCIGEKVKINNENDFELSIIYPNGVNWTGNSKSVTTLNPNISGVYHVGYVDGNTFVEAGTFTVKEGPTADFEFIDILDIYNDNGIPTTEVSATSAGTHYEWTYGDKKHVGKRATPHFFKNGKHKIRLTVTGSNGCKEHITKTVTINENYNLLAPTSFVPTDLDPVNNRFMPYALTVRNTAFRLIIIDRNDGHLIYETNDASEGWDGIDRQTGAMVKYENSYIWKVTINRPESGEKSEYAGTIIPLANRH